MFNKLIRTLSKNKLKISNRLVLAINKFHSSQRDSAKLSRKLKHNQISSISLKTKESKSESSLSIIWSTRILLTMLNQSSKRKRLKSSRRVTRVELSTTCLFFTLRDSRLKHKSTVVCCRQSNLHLLSTLSSFSCQSRSKVQLGSKISLDSTRRPSSLKNSLSTWRRMHQTQEKEALLLMPWAFIKVSSKRSISRSISASSQLFIIFKNSKARE